MDAVNILVEPLSVQKTVTPVEDEIFQYEVGQDLEAHNIPA